MRVVVREVSDPEASLTIAERYPVRADAVARKMMRMMQIMTLIKMMVIEMPLVTVKVVVKTTAIMTLMTKKLMRLIFRPALEAL